MPLKSSSEKSRSKLPSSRRTPKSTWKEKSLPKPITAPRYLVVDASLPSHVFNNRSLFTTYTPTRKLHRTPLGSEIMIQGIGDVHIHVRVKGISMSFRCRDAWHVPSSKNHLFSCSTTISLGNQVMLAGRTPRLIFSHKGRLLDPTLPKYIPFTRVDGNFIIKFDISSPVPILSPGPVMPTTQSASKTVATQSPSPMVHSLHASSMSSFPCPPFAGLTFNPHNLNSVEEERERRREDLGLGRPRTSHSSHLLQSSSHSLPPLLSTSTSAYEQPHCHQQQQQQRQPHPVPSSLTAGDTAADAMILSNLSVLPVNVSSIDSCQHEQFATRSPLLEPSHESPMISTPSSDLFSQMKNVGDPGSDDWIHFDKHHLLDLEEEEREQRQEDLGFGRRTSITSPHFSHQPFSSDDTYTQLQNLSKQVTNVMALTTTLEAHHSATQTTVQVLESKVEALEGMLKIANLEEALKVKTLQEGEAKEMANQEIWAAEKEKKDEKESLMEMLMEWKESVEGWLGHVTHVHEEWKEECERLNEDREHLDAKLGVTSQTRYTPTCFQMGTISTSTTAAPVPPPFSPSSSSHASPASPPVVNPVTQRAIWSRHPEHPSHWHALSPHARLPPDAVQQAIYLKTPPPSQPPSPFLSQLYVTILPTMQESMVEIMIRTGCSQGGREGDFNSTTG